MENGKCYVLVRKNYSGDGDISVFWKEEDARKEMLDDSGGVLEMLKEQGYKPSSIVTLKDFYGNTEIFVKDSNIYYEWNITEAGIR